jgi:hypothetical protein
MSSNNIEFDMSGQLKEKGASRIAKENNTIVIEYNENYLRFDIDYKSWMKTIKNFEDEAKGIVNDPILIQHIKSFFNIKYNEIFSNDNNSLDTNKNYEKEIIKIFKYSNYGKIPLHEAVILDGRPIFIKYDHGHQKIETVEKIVETTRIIIPPPRNEYPYTPYEFESKEELDKYIKRTKTITLDQLYTKCKSIFTKYVDQDNQIIILLTTDSIWTYFQDLFPTTHYFEGVGTNDVGKSSSGYTIEYTAYRVVKATAITGPNYYRLLGTIEPGQCVIIEDEGDSISEDSDKVKIFKAGYELDGKVPKINMNSKTQEQKWYYPYCYKVILAERALSQLKAKGVVDRTFTGHYKPGKPRHSIKNIVNNKLNKNPECLKLYNELLEFRKLMLCYRLIRYKNLLPEIVTGLKNRENELCNPTLQLFYGTQAIKEIIPTLEIFVKQRRDRRSNSLEAALYPIIKKIINSIKEDPLNKNKKNIEVYYSEIWNEIILGGIEGNQVKLNQYETSDYGMLYQNSLSTFIENKFGAKIDRKPRGSILIFDLDEFDKFEEIYGNDDNSSEVNINVKLVEKEETVDELSDIDNNQLQKIKEYDSSNNERKIDFQIDDGSMDISVDDEGNVSYVGILERVNTKEKDKEIPYSNNSLNDNKETNNLPLINNNPNLYENNNKEKDKHIIEPTQPTLLTSSTEKSPSKLNCSICDYTGIEVDMEVHLVEKHRYEIKNRDDIPGGDFDSKINVILERLKTGDKIYYASTIQ